MRGYLVAVRTAQFLLVDVPRPAHSPLPRRSAYHAAPDLIVSFKGLEFWPQ